MGYNEIKEQSQGRIFKHPALPITEQQVKFPRLYGYSVRKSDTIKQNDNTVQREHCEAVKNDDVKTVQKVHC